MIISYEANTPAEAWKYVLKKFPTHGVIVNGKKPVDDTKAIDGVIITKIKNPTDRVEKNPVYGQKFIDEYKTQFLNPDCNGFEYTYGNRLCAYSWANGVVSYEDELVVSQNQIGYIIKTLSKDKASRRAVAITWQPWVDEFVEDVPCLQLVKCRVMKNKLHMEVVFRSHDMLLGYYPNVLGLSYLMDHIADHVGVQKGSLTVVSLSPHVYYNRDRDVYKAVTGLSI